MIKFIVIIIIVGAGIALAFVLFNNQEKAAENNNEITATDVITVGASLKIKESADEDLAIAKAQELWRAALLSGEDLSNGPCLSNEVIPGWVADIVHSPRQDVDNLPANQCSAYRAGTAKHFVELDPQGNLIKAQ